MSEGPFTWDENGKRVPLTDDQLRRLTHTDGVGEFPDARTYTPEELKVARRIGRQRAFHALHEYMNSQGPGLGVFIFLAFLVLGLIILAVKTLWQAF
jgi:hypothetical protein